MIDIIEVAPRDGLQNESTLLDTASKVKLIERAVAAGARRIEATSFVNPKVVPAMADADEVMAAVPRHDAVSYIGVVLNRRGLDRALVAGVDEINAVVVGVDLTLERAAERDRDRPDHAEAATRRPRRTTNSAITSPSDSAAVIPRTMRG